MIAIAISLFLGGPALMALKVGPSDYVKMVDVVM